MLTHNQSRRVLACLVGMAALMLTSAAARAQLRESQVLVVYDSRIPDSLNVAEYYAGSTRVPGGLGNRSGMHPTVKTVDLSQLPGFEELRNIGGK